MVSPTKVREVMKKIYHHRYQLQRALNEAHDLKIIQYQDYDTESPCHSLFECKDRIDATTQEALADTPKKEIVRGIKGYY